MFGAKPAEDPSVPRIVYDEWKWTQPTYVISTKRKLTELTIAEIDPGQRMAEPNRKDNKLEMKW
jgi:hypothetical protein